MYALNAFSQDDAVATLTVSHLPDKVYSVLQMRAVQYKHHAEAEAREVLTSVVKPEARVRMEEALTELSRKIGLTNQDSEVFNQVRDRTPIGS